jgi:hypothetical protein
MIFANPEAPLDMASPCTLYCLYVIERMGASDYSFIFPHSLCLGSRFSIIFTTYLLITHRLLSLYPLPFTLYPLAQHSTAQHSTVQQSPVQSSKVHFINISQNLVSHQNSGLNLRLSATRKTSWFGLGVLGGLSGWVGLRSWALFTHVPAVSRISGFGSDMYLTCFGESFR